LIYSKKPEREAMVMPFNLVVATAVRQAKMPCTASAGICEFDGTRLFTDFSVVEQTNTQKHKNKHNTQRFEKRKADRKARGLQPWTGKTQDSSCGKDDRDSNEGEDEAEETDEDKDEVLFNEEVESKNEKAEDEMSEEKMPIRSAIVE